SSCRAAVDAGAIDEGFTDVAAACHESDVVVVAAPVDKIAELAILANQSLDQNALITDVGSTKGKIVDEIAASCASTAKKFVAAHPIAGSEKTGVENANADLLEGKLVILTPGDHVSEIMVRRAESFWIQTGSQLLSMSPREHDQRLAAVSHVPHLVSSLLASLLDDDSMPLVGSGWRDMTRVAAGDPGMWTAICQHNRDAILSQVDQFSDALDALRRRLADTDTTELMRWLEHAKSRKDATLE
ncbi:MAG: prephenate dehydrogenase/arogenate dehydrogenase family protein, partial [Planctomycetales bacterium]|nr:prephenate dehydrogenase/arogenate dehydrogenase family protein [Planctomycetales bacterium]